MYRHSMLLLLLLWAIPGWAADSATTLWFPSMSIPTSSTASQAGPTSTDDLRCMRWIPSMGIQSATKIVWGLGTGTPGSGSIAAYGDSGAEIFETGTQTLAASTTTPVTGLSYRKSVV